jgi:Fuc2NAc and GlcNAc transferase
MADAFSIASLALTVAAFTTVCLFLFEKSAARFAAMPRRVSAGRPGAVVPVGAGLMVAAVALCAGGLLNAPLTPPAWLLALAIGGILNALLGAADDLFDLSALPRLVIHLAIGWSVLLLHGVPSDHFQFLGWELPPLLLWVILPVYISWWTNLFNFMDGLDGMVSLQAAAIALWACFIVSGDGAPEVARYFACFGASFAAFLLFNWAPARLMLGDAGSTFGGFAIAMLTLLADRMQTMPLAASLILTAGLWVDATYTLLRRASRGERLHIAHLDHAYQHAAAQGHSHRRIAGGYGLVTLLWLGPLALLAARYDHLALPFLLLAIAPLVWFCVRLRAGLHTGAKR